MSQIESDRLLLLNEYSRNPSEELAWNIVVHLLPVIRNAVTPHIHRLCDYDDLVHEAIPAVLSSLEEFDSSKSSTYTFFGNISKRAVQQWIRNKWDHSRSKTRVVEESEDDPEGAADDLFRAIDSGQDLSLMARSISAGDPRVTRLALEGYSSREISCIIGKSRQWVNKKWSESKAEIREKFSEYSNEG